MLDDLNQEPTQFDICQTLKTFCSICSPFLFFFCIPQLYLWGSPFFFFFCIPQLYLWGSPFFFFFCVPSYISGVHHSSSSSVFPAISVGFTILLRPPAISLGFTILLLLLLRSQLYLWGSLFFFFCIPSYISGVHHSSSSFAFPAISLGFTILGEVFCTCNCFLIQPLR